VPDFVFINCPNCKTKIKIDRDKKYHDCEECKFEFCLDGAADISSGGKAGTSLLANLKKLQSSD
jgi:ribosomal protein L37AE/L43A